MSSIKLPKIDLNHENFRYALIGLGAILSIIMIIAIIIARSDKTEVRKQIATDIANDIVQGYTFTYYPEENKFIIQLEYDLSEQAKDEIKKDFIEYLKEEGIYNDVKDGDSINIEFILEASNYREYDMFGDSQTEEIPDNVILD